MTGSANQICPCRSILPFLQIWLSERSSSRKAPDARAVRLPKQYFQRCKTSALIFAATWLARLRQHDNYLFTQSPAL